MTDYRRCTANPYGRPCGAPAECVIVAPSGERYSRCRACAAMDIGAGSKAGEYWYQDKLDADPAPEPETELARVLREHRERPVQGSLDL